jgi:hypothetical protein
VEVADNGRTLLIPDRRGNNRIDGLKNLIEDPRIALIFLCLARMRRTASMAVRGLARIQTSSDASP